MAQPSLTMEIDEPSRVLLLKCEPKRHRWRQPIKLIHVISLYKGSISVDLFLGYAAMRVCMASNLKSGSSVPSLAYSLQGRSSRIMHSISGLNTLAIVYDGVEKHCDMDQK